MFGKPEWFQYSQVMRPSHWRGWLYFFGWVASIAIPCFVLLLRHQAPEALIWAVSLCGLLAWDVSKMRKSLAERTQGEVLYIGEE